MGYIFFNKEYHGQHYENLVLEGGFSSKKEIECPFEPGSEARTHRPSLSPQIATYVTNIKAQTRGGKS